MSDLVKELMCICMRNGVEIWKEADRLKGIDFEGVKFLEIDGEMLNTADIVGVFKAQNVEDMRRRKNGEWKCDWDRWHQRGGRCGCAEEAKWERLEKETEKIY